jgi:PAS domain-containing protein
MLAEWIKKYRGRLISAYITRCSEAEVDSEIRKRTDARVEALTRFVVAPIIALLTRALQDEEDWASGIRKIALSAQKARGLSILESMRSIQILHQIIRMRIQAAWETEMALREVASPAQQIAWISQLVDLEAQATYTLAAYCTTSHIREEGLGQRMKGQGASKQYFKLYQTMPEGIALHRVIYADSANPADSANLHEVDGMMELIPIDYVVVDANPAYEDIWGMRQVPISIGQKASDVYNIGDIPYLETYAEVAMSGNPTSFEITDELWGTTFQVSVFSPSKGQFATVVRDITQRKRREQKQQKLIAVLENSSDFIGLITFEGQSFYVNAAGRKMLGLEGQGQFVHTAFFEYFKPEDVPYLRQHVLPEVVEQGQWEGKLNFRDAKREIDIPVYCNIFVVKDIDSRTKPPLGLGVMGRSIDKHQRIESLRLESIHEIGAGDGSVSKVPIIPLVGNLEATQTEALTQAVLAGIREQKTDPSCASKIVVLDVPGLEAILEAQTTVALTSKLSHTMAKALKELGIDVDARETQS